MEWLSTLYEFLKNLAQWLLDNTFLKLYDWLLEFAQTMINYFGYLLNWIVQITPDLSSLGDGAPILDLNISSLDGGLFSIVQWLLPLDFMMGLLGILGAWAFTHLALVPVLRFLQVTK